MAISQLTRWDDVGSTPGAGLAKYVAGDQPISEYDNWFNWSAAKDVENLIAALENVTTGHDHDGTDSKKVDGGNVINTPAGNVAATDVQAAINELDTEKETPTGAQTKVNTHAADTSTHGVAEVADKATVTAEIDADIATHEADISVHGVAEVAGIADIIKGNFGDGSDGDVTISADTDLAGVVKQYNNLTIDAGYKLYDSTGFLSVKVKNILTLNGDIDQSGQGESGGAGGVGGGAGTGGSGGNGTQGITGKVGTGGVGDFTAGDNGTGNGSGGAGGGGGGSTYEGGNGGNALKGDITEASAFFLGENIKLSTLVGSSLKPAGSGGGGGACPGTGLGGDGGNGGGSLTVYAKNVTGSGSIKAGGINGANGNYSTNANCGTGGGGGGSGGFALFEHTGTFSGTVSANAGTGGTGYVQTYSGGDGTNGATGGVIHRTIS